MFFFGLIPIYLILGFLNKNVPIDMNISYIYYLINVDLWCYVTAVYFGLIGINYLSLSLIKKNPKRGLTTAHIILQILCVLPYWYAVFKLDEEGVLENESFFNSVDLKLLLIIGFLLFILSGIVHLINFFSSLVSKTD